MDTFVTTAVALLICSLILASPPDADADNGTIDLHGAAVVYKNSKQVFEHHDGEANIAWNIPVTAITRFRIGSVTKPMTAAIILELAAAKRLTLDDTVAQWLPDLEISGASDIRLHNLLSHTSGLHHFPDDEQFNQSRANITSSDELIAMFASRPLPFVPGSQWAYSNANYVLLGRIAERASGLTYAELVERYIARPSARPGIVHETLYAIIPQLAEPYYRSSEDQYSGLPYVSPIARYAAGSVVASTDDMAQWLLSLLDESSASTAIFTAMTQPVISLPDGVAAQAQVPPQYAYGWFVGEQTYAGCTANVIEHGGSILGYNARLRYLPDHNLIVSVASNTTRSVQAAVDELTVRYLDRRACKE